MLTDPTNKENRVKKVPGRWYRRPQLVVDGTATFTKVKQVGEGGQGKTVLYKEKNNPQHQIIVKKSLNAPESAEREVKIAKKFGKTIPFNYTTTKIEKGKEIQQARSAFIQEYAGRMDLWNLLYAPSASHLTLFQVFSYSLQIIDEVDFVHSKGFIHNDIKPLNLIIDPENHLITLVDFGLAAVTLSEINWRGTEGYAAPELYRQSNHQAFAEHYSENLAKLAIKNEAQFDAKQHRLDKHTASEKHDIYSLGVTLSGLWNSNTTDSPALKNQTEIKEFLEKMTDQISDHRPPIKEIRTFFQQQRNAYLKECSVDQEKVDAAYDSFKKLVDDSIAALDAKLAKKAGTRKTNKAHIKDVLGNKKALAILTKENFDIQRPETFYALKRKIELNPPSTENEKLFLLAEYSDDLMRITRRKLKPETMPTSLLTRIGDWLKRFTSLFRDNPLNKEKNYSSKAIASFIQDRAIKLRLMFFPPAKESGHPVNSHCPTAKPCNKI